MSKRQGVQAAMRNELLDPPSAQERRDARRIGKFTAITKLHEVAQQAAQSLGLLVDDIELRGAFSVFHVRSKSDATSDIELVNSLGRQLFDDGDPETAIALIRAEFEAVALAFKAASPKEPTP